MMGLIFPISGEGLVSLPLLYSVKASRKFDETSRYISGLRYSWVVSTYFPEHVQELAGKWHLQAGLSWLHRIPRKQPFVGTEKAKETEANRIVKTFISPYPVIVSAGVNWELHQFHYVRPILGVGYALNNPLDRDVLHHDSFLDKKAYFITASLFFSFDIVDSNFSHRMNYEYNIRDMGLFIEYQKYYSLGQKNQSHWGMNTGLFMAF